MNILSFSEMCRKKLRNLSIKHKIQLISIGCLLSLALVSLLLTHMLTRNYNRLLQDSVSASLRYANNDLTEKLDNALQLSYTILADASLQNRLIRLKTPSQNTERAEHYVQINSMLHSYYLNHQKDYISDISLYTSAFHCHTNAQKAAGFTTQQLDGILQAAKEAAGKAVWITDYTASQGLILCREIRQYKDLTLDNLGTLILCIDISEMLNSSPLFSGYDSFYYLIEDEKGSVFYTTLPESLAGSASFSDSQKQSLLHFNGHWYLSMTGSLRQNDWRYTCLVSYDNIAHTLTSSRLLSAVLLFSCILLILLVSQKLIESFTMHFAFLIRKMQLFSSSKDALQAPVIQNGYDYAGRRDEIGMLHQQFDRMASQIGELIQKTYTQELLVKEAKLRALEMQINPHFLYNTLESINWRAKAIGASQISLMAESLGNLFRAILRPSADSFSLEEELSLVEHYLTIQKCRFESRLQYEISAPPDLLHQHLPRMILQPLVENAISHAMDSLAEVCLIRIDIRRRADFLEIRVSNTGSRFADRLLEKLYDGTITPRGSGIGLMNIDQRIRLMFPQAGQLRLYNDPVPFAPPEASTAIAEICIPCKNQPLTSQNED